MLREQVGNCAVEIDTDESHRNLMYIVLQFTDHFKKLSVVDKSDSTKIEVVDNKGESSRLMWNKHIDHFSITSSDGIASFMDYEDESLADFIELLT